MSLFPFMNPVAYTTTNGHPISDIDDIDDDPEASGAFLSPPGENGSRGAGEQRKSYASVFFGSREPTRNKGPQHGYERMAQSAVTRPRRTSSPTPRSNGSLGNEYHSYYSDPAGSNSPTEPVLSSAFDFINPSGVSNPKGSRKQHEEYRVDSRSAQSSAFSFIESPQPQTSLGELAFAIPPSTSTTARLATTANSIILSSPPLTATHPAPTPPPLPRASVDNSRRLIAETRLKQTRSEIYRLTDYQARLFARRDVVREQLTERLKRAHELDAEQARALEKEDFAMAERVAAQVEEVRGAVEKLRTMLPDSDKRVREAGERVVDMMRRSVESARGTASECAALREERERSLHQFESDAQQMNGKQTDRISAEREEVERARSEVVSELEIWERNDAKCQERIDELIHDERAERDQHLAKRDAVRKETEELLNRLKHLQTEEEEHTRRVQDVDVRIREKTGGLAGEREELARGKEAIERRKEEVDGRVSRADDLDRQLHRMMEQQQQDKDRRWAEIDALNARAKNLNNEADEAEQEMEEVCRVRERVMKVETEMDEREKKVIDARVANDESDLTIKQLTKKVLQGQQALADIERDIATNEKQIPMLEEQKRLAVASREFKMAGQCSNRLKQLGATLEERRASLVSRTPVVEEDKRKLEEAQDEAKSQAGRLKEVEGRVGLEIYHTLDTLSAELRSSLRSATERGRKTLEALLQHELEGVRRRMEHVRVRYALADVPSANGGESDLLREVDELQQGDDDRPISQVGGKEREQARKEWVEDLEMKLRVAVNKEDYDTADLIEQQIRASN